MFHRRSTKKKAVRRNLAPQRRLLAATDPLLQSRLGIEPLEDRRMLATLNLAGGVLTFTLDAGAAASISGSGGNLTFNAGTGHTITTNATAQAPPSGYGTGAQSETGTLTGVTTVDITGGGAAATFAIGALTTTLPNLTIDTGFAGTTILGDTSPIISSGAQTYNSPVTLSSGTTLTSNGTGVSDNVTLASTVNGAQSLTVNTPGAIAIGGTVGGTAPLTSLTIGAAGTGFNLGGNVTTTGAQSYYTAVALAGNTTLAAGTGNVTFNSNVNSTAAGPFSLTVTTTGTTTFAHSAGFTYPLSSLTITAGGGATAINGASVNTTGAQTYNNAVTLGGPATLLNSTSGGAITFQSTVNGPSALTVNTTGATTFAGVVGGTTDLTSLAITAGGTTAINGASVNTTGGQTYNSPVTLGAAATLLLSTGATPPDAITFNSTLDGNSNLTVTTPGATTFAAQVGGTTALASVTITAGGGPTNLNGTSLGVNGAAAFNNPVLVGAANSVITGLTNSAAVTFNSTLDSAPGAHYGFTVQTPGTITFAQAVGGTTPLSALELPLSGTTDIDANVTTSGAGQTYAGPVVLGADVTLTDDIPSATSPSGINFGSTVDGAFALTAVSDGNTSFGGPVGGGTPLASVTVEGFTKVGDGSTSIAGNITTTGNQTYDNPVTLTGPSASTSTLNFSGTLTFNSTVYDANSPGAALSVNGNGTGTLSVNALANGESSPFLLTSNTVQVIPALAPTPEVQIGFQGLTSMPAVLNGTPNKLLTPAQVTAAYGIGNINFGATAGTGKGQTIAIIDVGDDPKMINTGAPGFSTSDLAVFDASEGLPDPPSFTVVGETGGARPTYSATPVTIVNAVETGTNVVVTTSTAPNVSINSEVTISGNSVAGFNSTFTVTGISGNTFTFTAASGLGTGVGGSEVQTADYGDGETSLDVEWAHAIAPQARILLVEMTAFQGANIADAVNTAVAAGAGVVSMSFGFTPEQASEKLLSKTASPVTITGATSSGTTVQITTSSNVANLGFAAGEQVAITGVGSGWNGTFQISAVTGTNTFTYIDTNPLGAVTLSSPTATIGAEDDGLFDVPGVTFVASSGDNGSFPVSNGQEYPASSPFVLAAGATNLNLNTVSQNILLASEAPANNVVTITTDASLNAAVGELVTVSGLPTGYNGAFPITSVNASANSFTYSDTGITGLPPSSQRGATAALLPINSYASEQGWSNPSPILSIAAPATVNTSASAATGANNATITTQNDTGLSLGDQVTLTGITGAGAFDDKTFVVTSVSGTTFTITAPTGFVAVPPGSALLTNAKAFPGNFTAFFGTGTNSGGSGGGDSSQESEPTFQTGVVPGALSNGDRTTPDVSIIGGTASPVPIVDNVDSRLEDAGTSLSAPVWAGLVAIADQGLALQGKTLLNSASAVQTDLYGLPAGDFHSITTGFNASGTGPNNETGGYSLLTGLGTPVANLLIPALTGTNITYTVPAAGSPHQLVLEKVNTNVELFDNGVMVGTSPVSTLSDVVITDANTSNDSLNVDYAADGIFPAQVSFNGNSAAYQTVTMTSPSTGPSNTIDLAESQFNAGQATITVDGTQQQINLSGVSEADLDAGPDGDAINITGAGGNSGLKQVTVNGGAGNDTLTVDSSLGLAAFAGGIHYYGGGGFDQLDLIQPGSATAQFGDTYSVGPNNGEGSSVITGPSGTQTVDFQNLAPVLDTVPAGMLTVNATPSSNAINYAPGDIDPIDDGLVTIDNQESMEFSDKTTLVINTGAGNDTVNLNNPGTPTGLTGIAVNGGNPNADTQDTLIANGTAGKDTITYSDSFLNSGNITGAGPVPISFTGMGNAVIDGQGGGDSLIVQPPVDTTGTYAITYSPGNASDAGTIQIANDVPVAYSHIGSSSGTGSVAIGLAGNSDKLIIEGTAGNDVFGLTPLSATSATVALNQQLPITTVGVTTLTLNGNGGVDEFDVTGTAPGGSPFTGGINVNAAGAAGDDPLFVTGPATDVNIAVGLFTTLGVQLIAGLGAPISVTGVGTVNIAGGGGADDTLLAVSDNANTNLLYTPGGNYLSNGGPATNTVNNAGSFTEAGVFPVFNFSEISGSFTALGSGAGSDAVTVEATSNNDAVVVNENTASVPNLPGRSVSVFNPSVSTTALKPVILDPATIQSVTAQGGFGSNSFLVVPAADVNGAGNLAAFVLPTNLLVNIIGGAIGASADSLVIANYTPGAGGVLNPTGFGTLPAADFAVVDRTTSSSGVVRVFQSGTTQFPDIDYSNVGIVQPVVATTTGPGGGATTSQSLVLGPDPNQPNSSLSTATYLGTGSTINASNLVIFPNAINNTFITADQSYFRVVAQQTGTLDIQINFTEEIGFLPNSGELQMLVYDQFGNLISGFGAGNPTSTNLANSNGQRVKIPVVAGESYYVRVFGLANTRVVDTYDPTSLTINSYSLSITNTAAPVPYDPQLNTVIAQGAVAAAPTPGTVLFSATSLANTATTSYVPLSTTNGYYIGKYLTFDDTASDTNNVLGETALITGYTYAAGVGTFVLAPPAAATPGLGLTVAPPTGAKFQIESSDTGISQLDSVTRINTPTIYFNLADSSLLNDLTGGGTTSNTPPIGTIPITYDNVAASNPPVVAPPVPTASAGYRLAVFDESNSANPVLLGFASPVPGLQGIYSFAVPAATPLTDGVHYITSEVQMVSQTKTGTPTVANVGYGASSTALVLDVDSQSPLVYFGTPANNFDGLAAQDQVGAPGETRVATPTFFGTAEADSVINVYAVVTNATQIAAGVTTVLLGQTTATPTNGTNQDATGAWKLTSTVSLSDPNYFSSPNGNRTLYVTATDPAGNISTVGPDQTMALLLVTEGPQITSIQSAFNGTINSVNGVPFDLFAPKPVATSPTPLTNQLVITVTSPLPAGTIAQGTVNGTVTPGLTTLSASSLPAPVTPLNPTTNGFYDGQYLTDVTTGQTALITNYVAATQTFTLAPANNNLGFTTVPAVGDSLIIEAAGPPGYLALLASTAQDVSNYALVGKSLGAIPIESALVTNIGLDAMGNPTATVTLTFATPLRNDIYTLTVTDALTDNAGNPLLGDVTSTAADGEPIFPTGIAAPPANLLAPPSNFVGSFMVDTDAMVGTYADASASLDLVGSGPTPFTLAIPGDLNDSMGIHDSVFEGNFLNPTTGLASGFSDLAAYGYDSSLGAFRWLINTDGTGTMGSVAPNGISATGSVFSVQPANAQLNALPIAGNFSGNSANGDELGLFTGTQFLLDLQPIGTAAGDIVDPALGPGAVEVVNTTMRGAPLVGDFLGGGVPDLATYLNGVFYVDVPTQPGGPGTPWVYSGNATLTVSFAFPGEAAQPIAGDMYGDGVSELGLWVPSASGTQATGGQFYFLTPAGYNPSTYVPGTVLPQAALAAASYTPAPLGFGLNVQYGTDEALPLVGIWDPPYSLAGTGAVPDPTNLGTVQAPLVTSSQALSTSSWLSVTPARNGNLEVSVGTANGGKVEASLYDSNYDLLATGTVNGAGNLTFSPTAVAGKTYFVHLTGLSAGTTGSVTVSNQVPLMQRLNVLQQGTTVTPADALAIINYLNSHGSTPDNLSPAANGGNSLLYYDVNMDGSIDPADALAVIDYLNQHPTSAVAPQVASIPAVAPQVAAPVSDTLSATVTPQVVGDEPISATGSGSSSSPLAAIAGTSSGSASSPSAVDAAVTAVFQQSGPPVTGSSTATSTTAGQGGSKSGTTTSATIAADGTASIDAALGDSTDWLN